MVTNEKHATKLYLNILDQYEISPDNTFLNVLHCNALWMQLQNDAKKEQKQNRKK